MATITIPSTYNGEGPEVHVRINGVDYTVKRGESVTVPDAVAAELQRVLNIKLLPTEPIPVPAPELLGGLDDVTIASAADGDVLTYDEDSGKWKNAEASGGNGGVLIVTEDADTGALNKTWKEIYDALAAGMLVNIPYSEVSNASFNLVSVVRASQEEYEVYLFPDSPSSGDPTYVVDSATGYPVYNDG